MKSFTAICFTLICTLSAVKWVGAAQDKKCCLCEYGNKPYATHNQSSEKRLVHYNLKGCRAYFNANKCDFSILQLAFETKLKTVSKEKVQSYQMLSAAVQKKITKLAEDKKCKTLGYAYYGHSGPHRAKSFIDNAFNLRENTNSKIVSCSNFGCSTFKNVKEAREYFKNKCKGDTCDTGEFFSISANRELFRPALGDYTPETLLESELKENTPNDISTTHNGKFPKEKIYKIEDQN